MSSKLDQSQIMKAVYDEVAQALKVVIANLTSEIELSAEDGDSIVALTGIEPRIPYDYIGYNYGTPNTTIKTYRSGGASGTIVGTVTEVYDAATPPRIISQTRT